MVVSPIYPMLLHVSINIIAVHVHFLSENVQSKGIEMTAMVTKVVEH